MLTNGLGQHASTTAFLFPGQGAQAVGMGLQLYEQSRAAREVFQAVDASLETPLSRMVFDGPAEELTRTVNSQPAVMTVSMACLKAMEEELGPELMPRPQVLAGHSLGEYTALVAGGVLDLESGIRLVRERGRLMQEASDRVPSGMAAIMGLDEVTVAELCQETGTQISNVNSDDQIVISGERVALARAMALASLRGARKSLPLRVSGAFHSELMRPAVEGMREALDSVRLRDPAIPVVANCTGRPLTTAAQIREELVQQLCQPVQWKRSVDFMVSSGISDFLEVGPGRVLSGLVRHINSNIVATPIGDLDAIRKLSH